MTQDQLCSIEGTDEACELCVTGEGKCLHPAPAFKPKPPGVCPYCQDGEFLAMIVCVNGQWQPWPLVAAYNEDWPRMKVNICPNCEEERYYKEEVPRINKFIDERNKRAAERGG